MNFPAIRAGLLRELALARKSLWTPFFAYTSYASLTMVNEKQHFFSLALDLESGDLMVQLIRTAFCIVLNAMAVNFSQ